MTGRFNARRFEGKVAIITGSSQGIGYAIAERLAHEGASVMISSRNQKNVDEAVRSLEESGISRPAVWRASRTFGKVDILVNSAGVNPAVGSVLNVRESELDKLFRVNVMAGFWLTKLVAKHMQKNGRSRPTLALVRALSAELAPLGIRVNSVVPSTIRADFSRLMWDSNHPHYGKATTAAEGVRSLLGRIGEPAEVAGAVAYLASDDASLFPARTT
ncbi:Dehydrogenase/reductase SDR family member 4 [Aphelenchoides fujianensis]|nr:Dehydrogenase/reductase SDR family member 4 [Aphelenchoides fujianensis]